jgi:hypothetical protein
MNVWTNSPVDLSPGNLSPLAASRRLRQAVVVLTFALGAAIALVRADVHPAWRALLFLPFFVAASGFYQGLYRT